MNRKEYARKYREENKEKMLKKRVIENYDMKGNVLTPETFDGVPKEQVDQMRIMTLVMAGLNGVEATRIVEAQRHTEKIREQGKNYAHNTAIINNHIEAMKDQQRNAHS